MNHVNSAGIASVEIVSTIDNPAVESSDSDLTELNKHLEGLSIQTGTEIRDDLFNKILPEKKMVLLKDLAETNLPCKSSVYVGYSNNPFDFVVMNTRFKNEEYK